VLLVCYLRDLALLEVAAMKAKVVKVDAQSCNVTIEIVRNSGRRERQTWHMPEAPHYSHMLLRELLVRRAEQVFVYAGYAIAALAFAVASYVALHALRMP